jgi:hypothetical protein
VDTAGTGICDTGVLSHRLARVIILLTVLLTAVAHAHVPLKRLQDQGRMLHISPRTYFGGLEYLPPQGPRTEVVTAYGVYGSSLLSLDPVLPGVVLLADVDLLAGPEHDEFDWIAAQYQYGVGWWFLPDWSLKFTCSAHALDTPLKATELRGPDYVIWNAPSVEYTPSVPCSWANVSADLQFYVFPPHNEYDPNPATPFPDRVVARYAADVSLLLDEICHSRFYGAARAFVPLGDSRPGACNWRADSIALFWQARIGYRATRSLSVFLEYAHVTDLGGIANPRELQATLALGLACSF